MSFYVASQKISESFAIYPLPKKLEEKMVEVGVWKSDCPVGINRLRLVKFIHHDFNHEQQHGCSP